MTYIQRRTVLSLILASIAVTAGLGAAPGAHADPVDLVVIDRDAGQVLGVWRHDGRQFVAGRPGARYSLRVTNNTNNRVLVVLSVDGVNIFTGETAGYAQTGYIVRPHESYEVSGWRTSASTVAAFNFTALSSSYAALTGRPSDVGVIGMAVFNERIVAAPLAAAGRGGDGNGARATLELMDGQRIAPAPAPSDPVTGVAIMASGTTISGVKPVGSPIQRISREEIQEVGATDLRSVLATMPVIQMSTGVAPQMGSRLGTGHGQIEPSVVTMMPFERATPYPAITWQVEYDSYDNLVAKGVIPPPLGRPPQPFPGAGYVPDPPR